MYVYILKKLKKIRMFLKYKKFNNCLLNWKKKLFLMLDVVLLNLWDN